MNPPMRILACRTDHLGDVLLSLKALLTLRQSCPEATLRFVVQKSVGEVISAFCEVHRIELEWANQKRWQKENWDIFLALHCEFQLAFEAFRKGIPLRVGQNKHFWSYLFFNQGLRQKRTLMGKHESDYSTDLAELAVQNLNQKVCSYDEAMELPLEPQKQREAKEALSKIGISTDEAFYILHPGMAGSALNLSSEKYLGMVRALKEKMTVVLSVGPSEKDRTIWNALMQEFPELKRIPSVSLGVLKEVYRMSQGVIAPSTGPLHLAHLVGVPVIGLYSPVLAQHPRRWKPVGGRVPARVFSPQVDCPAQKKCWGERCRAYPCMEKTSWTDLILGTVSDLTTSYAN